VLEIKEGYNSVIVSKPNGGLNQLWDFNIDGTIRCKLDLLLDVSEGKIQPWTPVIACLKHGRWSQIFKTVTVGE
jgi:hypothetical protein